MGLFDKFKKKPEPVVEAPVVEKKPKKTRKPAVKKPAAKKKPKLKVNPDKQEATDKGEAYINIVSVELDPDNIGNGAFELDWNEFFVAKLVRAGYKGKDDEQIVDQWFQDVCRHVVLETYEQYEANNPRPLNPIQRKDLGDGRTEVS